MTDLREALRIAEIEIGRLRTRNRELEDRIREQEADALAGDIDGAELQNELARLRQMVADLSENPTIAS